MQIAAFAYGEHHKHLSIQGGGNVLYLFMYDYS